MLLVGFVLKEENSKEQEKGDDFICYLLLIQVKFSQSYTDDNSRYQGK